MVRKTKKNVKSNSLQKNWYYGIKYIDSMNKYWYSSFYSLYVNGWITHIFLLKNMVTYYSDIHTPTYTYSSLRVNQKTNSNRLASEEFNDTRVAVLDHLPRFLKKSKIAASCDPLHLLYLKKKFGIQ